MCDILLHKGLEIGFNSGRWVKKLNRNQTNKHMLEPRLIKKFAFVAVAIASVSTLLAAEPMAPETTPQMGTESGWMAQASGDYFNYKLDWDFGPNRAKYNEKGDEYGGTVYTKFPFMKLDDWIEVSYRQGRFTANGVLTGGNAWSDTTDTTELVGQYRMGLWKDRPQDPMFKLDLLAGVTWDYSDDSYRVPANNNSIDRLRDDTFLFNAGISVSWYALTKRSEDGSKRFRLGLRAEGLGEVGATLETETGAATGVNVYNEYDPWLTYGLNGRGLLFADYKLGNFSIILEGGYQFRELWYDYTRMDLNTGVPYSDTETRESYGPYVRAGIGYAF
jgi:hypothetical protein